MTSPDPRAAADRSKHQPVRIGLVNNMPDTALESTEAQFSSLLREASPDGDVRLELAYLPEIPRSGAALERVRRHYWPVEELLGNSLDAIIVTGLEPGSRPLSEEPYWPRLCQLLAWAEEHTLSSLWSCLGAHAAVLRLSGIARRRLPTKCFGVFAHDVTREHPLVRGMSQPVRVPHSRWNELPSAELERAGFAILTSSPDSGADLFIREGASPLVFLQGHPEYDTTTLLREFRRDVGRYLRGEQPEYPRLPQGYFAPDAVALLETFEARARAERDADLLGCFPFDTLAAGIENSWRAGAIALFSNWLAFVSGAVRWPTPQESVALDRA